MNIKSKISDTVNPDQFRQVSETEYVFQKDGQDAYTLNKKDKHWECSCPAYKFHKKCKHSQLLEEQLKPADEEKPKRHPRAEMEKFIPELTKICEPFDTWCLADDVVLFSRKGPIKVADLKSGMEIWDGEKFSKATVVVRKRVPTYKVTFVSGHKIECSRDHKFLAKGWKGVPVFREVTASKNTQFVFSQTAIEFETEEFVQEAPAKFSSGIKQLNLNNLDKRELAYWIGRCLGDGTVSNKEQQENGNFYVRMAFGKNELPEAERYQAFLKSLGLQVDIVEAETALSVDVFCKNLQKLFEFYGMTDGRAATKKLGIGCYKFSVPERLSLIDGYVDADGYVCKGSASISSVSLQLLEDFQQLCHSVGLTSSLRGPYRGGSRIICDKECVTKPEYRLYIRKHGMTTKVREVVESINYVTTIYIDDPKHQYYSGGLISKNCIVGSWRRKSPDFKDVDVIALASDSEWKQVHHNLVNSGAWEEFIFGPTLMRGMYHGYYLDFNLCPSEDDWLWWLIYRTGSQAENVALRKRAIQMGYAISEKGVQDRFTFEYVDGINTEADFYHFLGLEYRKPEERDGQNFKELKDWKMEEHLSPGKQAMDQGDFDWHDYIIASIDKLKDRTTVYRSAKYPARLAILVAREIARRVNQPVAAILKNVTPEEIQPEGFKKGQQTWDKDGNIITVK